MTDLKMHNETAVLTLNHPPDNRLTSPVWVDPRALLAFLDKNKAKSLVITGAGRHFSNGADLASIQTMLKTGELAKQLKQGKELLQNLYQLNIPVIAAIEGICFGGGLEIALSTHLRIMSDKSLMAFPESMQNLMPGLTGNWLIKKHLTLGKSMEMLLGNKVFSADEALQEGLTDFICPSKSTLEFALSLSKKMTKDKPMHVIQHVMQALKNSYEMPREEAMKEETRLFCELTQQMINDEK